MIHDVTARTERVGVRSPGSSASPSVTLPIGITFEAGRTFDSLHWIGGSPESRTGQHRWYQLRYHNRMAMTLRLADDETDALRRRAELERRSMQ